MVKLRDTNSDTQKAPKAERLWSVDAARGFLLFLLIANGFGLRQVVGGDRWNWLVNQWTPREWDGCSLLDLLQPAFLIVVGMAMPYSYEKRQAKSQTWLGQFIHAIIRAAILISIGIYLDSYAQNQLLWKEPRGDLQQIGLAYLLAFFVVPIGMPAQGVTLAFLLIGHTAAYVIYAFAGGHDVWQKTHHIGIAIDQWLGLAPHRDGLVVFNVIGNTALVVGGILISGIVRSGLTAGAKVAIMAGCSVFTIVFAWILSGGNGIIEFSWFAMIPMIKRLATWTFVFNAIGWTTLAFSYSYLLIDGFGMRAWSLPLIVLGRNSLLLFVTYRLFRDWASKSAMLLIPQSPELASAWRPILVELFVAALFWLLALWLYRRRIFLKV